MNESSARKDRDATQPFLSLGRAPRGLDDEPAPKASDVGTLLCATRMRLGKDLQVIAEVLHIRYTYLVAIEDGRYEDLPGQAYAVGFVRAYADHLGLDGGEVVRRFKEENSGLKRKATFEFPVPTPDSGVPSGVLLAVAVVMGMVVYGVWYTLAGSDRGAVEVIQEVPDRLTALLEQPPAAGNAAPVAETVTPETTIETPAPEEAAPAETAATEETASVEAAAVETPAVAETQTPAPVAAVPAIETPAPQTASIVAEAPAVQTPAPAAETPVAAAPVTPAPKPTPPPAQAETPAPKPAPTAGTTAAVEPPRTEAAKPETSKPEASKPEAPKVETPKTETSAPAPAKPAETATAKPTDAAPPPVETKPAEAKPAPAAPATPEPAAAPPPAAEQVASLPTAETPPAEPAVIELRAKSDSWIQVRAGEQLLLTRLLRKGEVYRVPDDRTGLTLMTGNAGGLEVLVDGVVAPPLGTEGVVARGVPLNAAALRAGVPPAQ